MKAYLSGLSVLIDPLLDKDDSSITKKQLDAIVLDDNFYWAR